MVKIMPTEQEVKTLFSKRLTEIMEKHNINQVELSKVLNVSESTVGKWLLMKAMPRMGVIQKLADYFNVGKSYFLEESLDYHEDPEVAALAEEARTNPDIRILFSAAKDISKENMQKTIDFVNFLKSQERSDNDFSE